MNRMIYPLLCLVYGWVYAQTPLPFHVGEILQYNASFNFVIAGNAKLEVVSIDTVDNFPVYHIIYTVKSNPLLDRLYKIRDKVETWIDKEGYFTRKFNKKIREGNFKKQYSATINYTDSLVHTNEGQFSLHATLRDPYSLFYYLRTIPLAEGDIYPLTVFDDNKFTDLQFIVRKREWLQVPAGKFNCLMIEPFKEDGFLFKSRGNMTVWISDDNRRLPVKIILKAKFGSMVLKLKSFTP